MRGQERLDARGGKGIEALILRFVMRFAQNGDVAFDVVIRLGHVRLHPVRPIALKLVQQVNGRSVHNVLARIVRDCIPERQSNIRRHVVR